VRDRNVTSSPLRWLVAHRVRSFRQAKTRTKTCKVNDAMCRPAARAVGLMLLTVGPP
jgi:hypothetical protein